MTAPTRVKICGMTRLEDAQLAVELGATAIGFIFWPKSPRVVDPVHARAIARAVSARVSLVGVFVDQTVAEVGRIAEDVGLDAVQLHGHEQPSEYASVPRPLIKVMPIGDDFDRHAFDDLPNYVTPLLDAHDPVKRGGTGRTIDWTVAATLAAVRPVFLAGGLRPDNVADAVARVRPYGVDVSSGVEAAPGIKDHEKMRALFGAIQRADAEQA